MFNVALLLMLWAPLFLPAEAWAEETGYQARMRIESAVARLSDPKATAALADIAVDVMAEIDMNWHAPTKPENAPRTFVPTSGAVIEMVDIRLILAQISIQVGARGHVVLSRAQGERDRNVILLRGGFVTLMDLFVLSRGTAAEPFVIKTPEGVILTRPLAVWPDAGLSLGTSDQLKLDRPHGSFVVNLGWLDVAGGHIGGTGRINQSEPAFRPFVLTAGQGSFTAHAATFQALGFGDTPPYGGIAIVNSGLMAHHFTSALTQSTVTDVSTLALIGTTGAALSDNRITGSNGVAIVVAQAQHSVVARNTLSMLQGPQAIRVTSKATNVLISGNLMNGAARMGMLIDGDSNIVRIEKNLIAGNLMTAIGVDGATCITIVDNLVVANGGTGISLTDTDGARAVNNAILFNEGSGVLLRNQASTATVRVAGNVLIGNRDGLRGATPGHVILEGNNLDGQLPRVFAGDLAPLTVQWLRERREGVALSIPPPPISPCSLSGNR